MKKSLVFFIVFFVVLTSFSQNVSIDSLQQLLQAETNADKKIRLHLQLYHQKKSISKEAAFLNLKFAEKIIHPKTNDSIKTEVYIVNSQYYLLIHRYDSVFYYAEKALKNNNVISNKNLIGLYTSIGLANYHKTEYKKAIEAHQKALKISESINKQPSQARVLNNIGSTYIKLKDWNKAESYMNKSLELCRQFDIKRGITYTLGNLGIIYKNQGKFNQAIAMYLKSIKTSELLNDKVAIIRNYTNIGSLYEEQKDYNKALNVYNIALKIANEQNEKKAKSNLLLNMASIYANQKKFNLAEDNYIKSLEISKEKGLIDFVAETYLGLAEVYEYKGDFKQSIIERKEYEKWKDSIISKEHLSDIGELEIKYQTEKKDNQIVEQKLLLGLNEVELLKKRNQFYWALAGGFFFFLSSLGIWLVYKQRQKRKDQELLVIKNKAQINALESLIEGEEKERFRIAKELHDGVNGDLSAIKHKLNTLLKLNNKTIEETVTMIDKSCEQVRAISHNLVPPALENFDLQTAASDYCTNMNAIHNPKISFDYYGDPIILPKIIEVNLYRIIQELVNNSIKHANAKNIHVELSSVASGIQLSVEDDGKGFGFKHLESDGIGISNVKHRVAFLNGEIDFLSSNEGTSVNIFIDKLNINND